MTGNDSDATNPIRDTDLARDRSLSLDKEMIKELDTADSDADAIKGGGTYGTGSMSFGQVPIKPLA